MTEPVNPQPNVDGYRPYDRNEDPCLFDRDYFENLLPQDVFPPYDRTILTRPTHVNAEDMLGQCPAPHDPMPHAPGNYGQGAHAQTRT